MARIVLRIATIHHGTNRPDPFLKGCFAWIRSRRYTPQHRSIWVRSNRPLRCDAMLCYAMLCYAMLCERRSAQDRRTARAARQGGSNVDLLGDTQRIFKFDAKISDCAVNLGMSEQKLNRSEISGFAVYLRCFCPAQRMGAVSTGLQPDRRHPIPHKPAILAR